MLIYLFNFLITLTLESAHGFNTAYYARNVEDNGIDKVNSKGALLYSALKNNNITMAKDLIENGLDLNVLLPDQKSLLHLAAKNGDENAIKNLLNMTKLINKVDIYGRTPLHYAAINGRLTACQILISNGANLFAKDTAGNMPIHVAIKRGSVFVLIVQTFLNKNSGLTEARGKYDRTPLHLASYYGFNEIITILLQKYKADIFVEDKYNDMPVHLACFQGKIHSVRLLLFYNSSLIEAPGQSKNRLLHYAVWNGHFELTKFLLIKHADINATANYDYDDISDPPHATPLHIAAIKGDTNIINLLLQYNALLYAKDKNGFMPVHLAVIHGKTEPVQKFLSFEPTLLNARCNLNMTLLHLAAQFGFQDILKILLNSKADIFAIDVYNNSPIHHACRNGRINAVNILIDYNSSLIEMKGSSKFRPLHFAVWNDHFELIKLLLIKHADINATANDFDDDISDAPSITALHLAAKKGNPDITDLLLQYNALLYAKDKNGFMPVHLAVIHGKTECVQKILDFNPSLIYARCIFNQTLLHLAAYFGYKDILKLLLTLKADIFAVDVHNNLPIHLACHNGGINAVNILIDYNSNLIEMEGSSKFRPLHYAVWNDHFELIKLLLIKHADINATANDFDDNISDVPSITALHLAAKKGNPDIIDLLLQYNALLYAKDKNGFMPVHLAVIHGKTESVQKFLSFEPTLLSARCNLNMTLLHLAAQFGFQDILKLLLNLHADAFARDINNDTPIHLAIKHGRLDSFLVLVQHNPKLINVRGYSNFLPLHYAVYFSRIDILEWLIKYGSNVDSIVDKDTLGKGTTGLHLAAKYNLPNSLCMLLYYGANISIQDRNNDTPLSLAFKENATLVYHILNKYKIISNQIKGKMVSKQNMTMGLHSFHKYSNEIQSLASSSPNGHVVPLEYFKISAAGSIMIIFGVCLVFFRKCQLRFKTIKKVQGFSPGSNAKDLKIFVQNKKSENMINLKYLPVTFSMENDSERSSQTNAAAFGNARAV